MLGFDVSQAELRKYSALEGRINNFINNQIGQKKASSVSVYYRDLESASWFGVNENLAYQPASLIKIAIMLTYFKEAQSNPEILDKKILYKNLSLTSRPHDSYNLSANLKEGNYYTVKELINGMIADSDNIAKDLLINNIGSTYLQEVFSDLGLQSPADVALGSYKISPQKYSLFFRILYNSTYLNNDFSELAMDMLSHASFKDGLVAGLPNDVTVAHKFGESAVYDNSGALTGVELHDCGIIFYPKDKPFFLCVMTQGYDFNNLSNIIKNVSDMVFEYTKVH